jgi:hypothetical protein
MRLSSSAADCLLGLLKQQAGCEATFTLDKRAARLPTHRTVEV